MKHLFCYEDILICFIGALAYGFTYTIPTALGINIYLSVAICCLLGWQIENLMANFINSDFFKGSLLRKIFLTILIATVFITLNIVSIKSLDHNLIDDVAEMAFYLFFIPLIGFLITITKHNLRAKKLRKLYGDGSDGVLLNTKLFSKLVNKYIGKNKEIKKEYTKKYAVKTRTGIYVGKKENQVVHYLGIPYAKQPIEHLRWKAPVDLEDDNKVYEAYYFGSSCYQPESEYFSLFNMGEDCLNLNIWKSSKRKLSNAPVLVYIHGGAYSSGTSAFPSYYGQRFVKKNKNIIYVSINYRLNLFGSIDFSETLDADEYKDSKNLFLQDQIAALKWIKENISNFGGNPDNITLIGDTTGAMGIAHLAVCNKAKNLFKKAILLSAYTEFVISQNALKTSSNRLLKKFNATKVNDLINLDISEIMPVVNEDLLFGAVADDVYIQSNIHKAFEQGLAKDIDIIIGISGNEFGSWVTFMSEDIAEAYTDVYLNELIENSPKEKQLSLTSYLKELENYGFSKKEARQRLFNDYFFKLNLLNLSKMHVKGKGTTRIFYWNLYSPIKKFGSSSIGAILSILSNNVLSEFFGFNEYSKVEKFFQRLLVNFIKNDIPEIKTGEFYHEKSIKWPQLNNDKNDVLLYISRDDIKTQPTNLIEKYINTKDFF
ncbi:MAG: carboxylesterase family protein [Alphaproteobacteria bacterium]|nr:carboxylesterase family protein [Alphaproteobacteria bacterium]